MGEEKQRSYLAGEHAFGDLGQILLLIFFLIIWFSDSYIYNFSIDYTEYLPIQYRIVIATIILIFSAILVSSGLSLLFGKYKHVRGIIRFGIYNKVRHPIYLGSILFYLGFIILSFSMASFVWWILVILFYNFIARYEEKQLKNQYGDAFIQYKKEVGRWFPKFF